jgi:hypothetical protein
MWSPMASSVGDTISTETRVRLRVLVLLLSAAAAATAHADPWLVPGDEALRSDIHRIADAGILRGPVTTWPLSWPDLARDALSARADGLDPATASALVRVQRRARIAAERGFAGAGFRVGASYEPSPLRSFADSPREEGEVALRTSWLSDHFALNLQGAYVADPDDRKAFRPDGSYIGVNLGNFMISAGFMERWWGPGWDGSLILSNNARPIPSLTIERNYTDPFETKLLSWLGPWRASIAVGEAESHDVPLPNVRFMAARFNFKPKPWLEVALTRTAQWCGGQRPCDWGTLSDMLVGRDNSVAVVDQPGNQMAGYDMRLRSPWHRLPLAFYSQWIGEDEAGGLPSKFIGLLGIESWGTSPLGAWLLRAEHADTACSFTRQTPQFDCAYRNSIYPQGYAYRGRIMGHSIDNDSRLYTVAGLLTRPDGDSLSLSFRRLELNRNGFAHAISDVPLDVDNVELRYSRGVRAGTVSLGIGFEDPAMAGNSSSRVHGFAVWQQGF